MRKPKVRPPCGNPECAISTGICGSLTYGSGELSDNGYWEFPCEVCADFFEKAHPESPSGTTPGSMDFWSRLLDENLIEKIRAL